jgi:hypothetical protein
MTTTRIPANITPDDLDWVRYDTLRVGDRQIHNVHRINQHTADRPTQRQLNAAKGMMTTVDAIGPYIPAPGARNAAAADTIMVINPGAADESTGLKSHFVWIVKR